MEEIAKKIRRNLISILLPDVSHHIGSSLSIIEILTVLYFKILNIDPNNPQDKNRDIFILSKGHAASALYSTLFEKGFFNNDILSSFDRDGGTLPEHVSKVVPGVELATGSLGHGLPVACGFAYSSKIDKKNNRIYCLVSGGELNEGSNWEAFLFAFQKKLDNLIIILDHNKYQGFGEGKEILNIEPLREKLIAFGFNIYEVDGHDMSKIEEALVSAKENLNQKPHFIIAKTIKGKGIKKYEEKPYESHYMGITNEEKIEILKELI